MRRQRLAVTAVWTVLVLAAGWGVPAAGHPVAVDATRDGPEIVVAFGSPVEPAPMTVRGAAARRDPFDPNLVRVTPAPGATTVELTVLSRDGHVGRVQVDPAAASARDTGGAADPPAVLIGRALLLAGWIGAAGIALFALLVVAPGLAAPLRPVGEREDPARRVRLESALVPTAGCAVRIAGWCVAAGVTGTVLVVAGTLAALDTGPGELGRLLTGTRLGVSALVSLVAGGLAAAAAVRLRRGPADGPARMAATAAIAVLAAISWSGHATSGGDAVLSFVFDAVHLVATAAWTGGLIGLVVLLPALRRRAEPGDRTALAGAIVVRFSTVALICVALLVVTGTYRALAELAALDDLVGTAYGRALAVKLALFACMLALGARNRFVLHPRLERAALGTGAGGDESAGALGRSVRAELLLAGMVVLAVAAMVGLAPP